MKQWGFKDYRKIFMANLRFSANETFAYYLNNFGGIASIFFYVLMLTFFLTAVFSKFRVIAGYSFSELLLLSAVHQLSFYIMWAMSFNNISRLGESIKTGELDLILTKPLPHLFYLTFRRIDLNQMIVGTITGLSPLLYLMYFNHDFKITYWGLGFGLINYGFGLVATHCFTFICNLPSFWTGEYKAFKNLSQELIWYSESLPWDGYPKTLQYVGLFIIPNLIHTAVTAAIILGKMDPRIILVTGTVALVFSFFKEKSWAFALRHYSSASS